MKEPKKSLIERLLFIFGYIPAKSAGAELASAFWLLRSRNERSITLGVFDKVVKLQIEYKRPFEP